MTIGSTGAAITVEGLTKRYGDLVALDDLSFSVHAGSVTGFLGPNGAGKTTALKAIVGIARPTAGRVVIHGAPVHSAHAGARVLGVYIEPTGAHPGRSARNHLRTLAALAGLPRGRADDVLGIVGLEDAAGRRVGTFSTGMRQRLGLASALLGDPDVLVLDEPLNGLDPQGIRWLRSFLRERAAAGGTVMLEVVGEAADGREAIDRVREALPDVVLMDIRMPNMDGIEATSVLTGGAIELAPRVLVLTTFELDEYVFGALRAGATGFLLKDASRERLVEAIRVVHAGDVLLSPSITRRLIEDFAARRDPIEPSSAVLAELTRREREVLVLVGHGLSQAVVFAYEHGIVVPGEPG